MTDWEQLRELTHQVRPPDFESMVHTANRRKRRARAAGVVLASAILVGGSIGVAAIDDGDDGRIQPGQDLTESPTEAPDDVRAIPEPDPSQTFATLDDARYRIPLGDTLAFEVDLPKGTYAHDDGLFLASQEIILKVEVADEAYGVPAYTCGAPYELDPAGRTTADLVDAIRRHPAFLTSRPERVTIDGAEGQHLTVRIRPGSPAEDCPDRQVVLPGHPATNVYLQLPYRGEWTVLDVDGQRVVIHQLCGECRADAADRMTRTLRSITFTPTP